MEPFKVYVLGCGSAQPTTRHHASSQVVELRGKVFLVDCAEGTQVEIRRVHCRFSKLSHIFISHLHGDHCLGLVGLISSFGLSGRSAPLHVHAHSSFAPLLQQMLDFFCPNLSFPVVFHPVDTTHSEVVYEDHSLTVTTIPLEHRVPCCGYLFREKPTLPHIRRDMLDLYQNANAVYTFRLHCTLPTLALGTPVLLIRKSFKSDRFVPHQDYVHHCTTKDFLAGKFDSWMQNPPPNPETYLPVRRQLEETVSAFIAQCKQETRKASELCKTTYSDQELLQWQNETMKLTLHNYFIEEHIDLRELIAARRELETLRAELEETQRQVADYHALGSPKQVQKDLRAYRALGSVPEVQTAVRRYRKLMNLPPVRLLKRMYRFFKKNK